MNKRIVSDSSCDIWTLEGVDFKTVPLTISTREKTYVDDEYMNVRDMLEYLAAYKGSSTTACPGIDSWLKAFDGADEIYVTTLTSGLSGTYNSAMVARGMYLEKHPGAKVLVIDTLSTSGEQLLLIEKLRDLIAEGRTFEEISEAIQAYRQHTRLFFAFRSLHNLAQNGRVPKLLAQALGILGISIIGTASQEGTVEPIGKSRGKNAVISNLMQQLGKAGYQGGKVRIAHAENEELSEQLKTAILKAYPAADVTIRPTRGLVGYYAERGGIVIGAECK